MHEWTIKNKKIANRTLFFCLFSLKQFCHHLLVRVTVFLCREHFFMLSEHLARKPHGAPRPTLIATLLSGATEHQITSSEQVARAFALLAIAQLLLWYNLYFLQTPPFFSFFFWKKLSLTLGPNLKAMEIIKTDISRVKRQVEGRTEKGNSPAS